MQHFTQEDFSPRPSTILFIKQFARMCNTKQQVSANGYHHIPIVACC